MYIQANNREELAAILAYNLLTPGEAAELLSVSKASMTNLKNRGSLQPAKVSSSGQVMYLRSDILKYKQRKEKGNKELPLLCNPGTLEFFSEQAAIQALSSAGLLAIFPARISTPVFCTNVIDGKLVPGVIEMYTDIDGNGNGNMVIRLIENVSDIVSITCGWHELGRTVFLSENEAQAHLLRAAAIIKEG